MKKRIHLLAMAVLCLFTANAQTPDWKWFQFGSGTSVSGNSVATDADGNSYYTGNFSSSVTFGTKTLVSLKASSIFIAKFDNTGKMLWVKQADNTVYGNISSNAIAIDASGNCYIAGSFTYTILMDTTHLTTTGSPTAISDMYIAKYDKDGNFVWVQHPKHASNYGYNYSANSITLDANNMLTICGTGSYKVDFGNSVIVTGGPNGAIMAQFDASGKAQWAKEFYDKDGVGSFSATSIANDKNGNLFICGTGSGQKTDFGGSATVDFNTGYFIGKYSSSGAYSWVNTVYAAQAFAIAVDGSGNPAITGNMGSSVDFDKSTNVKSYGGYDIFAAKYDGAGNLKWVQHAGTKGDEKEASSILEDADGNVYISGSISASSQFDTKSIPAETKIPGYGYVAKYDNSGAIQWLQNMTLTTGQFFSNSSHFYDISLDGSGNIFVVGNTAPATSFGSFNASGYGLFIAKIGSGTAPTPPAAPTNLSALAKKKKDDGKIQLSWTDNSNNETGFIINRSPDGNSWTAIDSVGSNVATYLDSNLVNLTTYYYKVDAYNSSGVSAFTNSVSATTLESGINENTGLRNPMITSYPNPSNSDFAIQLPLQNENFKIRILNVLGQVVSENAIAVQNGNCFKISLPQNVKGMIMIEISGSNTSYQLRHIIL